MADKAGYTQVAKNIRANLRFDTIMTIPTERTRAVIQAEELLLDLVSSRKTPRIPKEIRDRAARILRHYPSKYDMELAAETSPELFGELDAVFSYKTTKEILDHA